MMSLCSPALVYVVASLIEIIIHFIKGHTNIALIKMIVTSILTVIINFLCKKGLILISWIIVIISVVDVNIFTFSLL